MMQRLIAIVIVITCTIPARAQTSSAADMIEFRGPAPPNVGKREHKIGFEMSAPTGWPRIHKAEDGRLMMIGGGRIRYSKDGGRSWIAGDEKVPCEQVIRLQDGSLAGLGTGTIKTEQGEKSANKIFVSKDEGKTWTELEGDVTAGGRGGPYPNTLYQTRDGRMLLPMRYTNAGHDGHYAHGGSWGTLNGKLTHVEGHAHYPEADVGYLCLSDNGGNSWYRSEGGILIWHHEGHGGMWPCDEPSIIDGRDGAIYMLMRTTLGRLYLARSAPARYVDIAGRTVTRSAGRQFDHPLPTSLAGSYSPCTVSLIPKTGDWLVAWNQVSGDEIRAGYRRGRLSTAVSKDDGKTWQHHRTIDTSVLPPAGRVAPDDSPRMARGLDYLGVLPEDYGGISYPTISVVDDQVFITYYRVVVRPRPGDVTGRIMRVLPLSWFYEDEPALTPGPRVVVKVPSPDGRNWNSVEPPSTYFRGRFYINSKDVQRHLKSTFGRFDQNIFAPLHQVITAMGWIPEYDRTHIEDAGDPRLIVRCQHAFSKPVTEKILVENPANADIWTYRNGTMFIGALTKDASAAEYSYSRVGHYDAAQSITFKQTIKITALEVFLSGHYDVKKGVTLTLCEDDGGLPTTNPIAPGAAGTIGAFGRGHDFRTFSFAAPVTVKAGRRVWMVMTKTDEPGTENPMFGIPVSVKDEKDERRDWYPDGDFADRGPYTDRNKPSAWRVRKGHDAYFRVIVQIE